MIYCIKLIWHRNMILYKRDYIDVLSMWLRPLLFIIPLFLFAKFVANDYKSILFLVASGMLTSTIMNTIVDTNFEIYQEIDSGTYLTILMSPISFEKYVWSQALFKALIMNIELAIVFIALGNKALPISNIILIVVSLICIDFISICFALLLSLLTLKLRTFRYSSLLTNLILLFSGMFYSINILPKSLFITSLVSPFTYGIDLIRNQFIQSKTFLAPWIEVVIIICYTLFLLYISRWLFKKYLLKLHEEG